jgi:hydrogenase/urease accessory protein HupE
MAGRLGRRVTMVVGAILALLAGGAVGYAIGQGSQARAFTVQTGMAYAVPSGGGLSGDHTNRESRVDGVCVQAPAALPGLTRRERATTAARHACRTTT